MKHQLFFSKILNVVVVVSILLGSALPVAAMGSTTPTSEPFKDLPFLKSSAYDPSFFDSTASILSDIWAGAEDSLLFGKGRQVPFAPLPRVPSWPSPFASEPALADPLHGASALFPVDDSFYANDAHTLDIPSIFDSEPLSLADTRRDTTWTDISLNGSFNLPENTFYNHSLANVAQFKAPETASFSSSSTGPITSTSSLSAPQSSYTIYLPLIINQSFDSFGVTISASKGGTLAAGELTVNIKAGAVTAPTRIQAVKVSQPNGETTAQGLRKTPYQWELSGWRLNNGQVVSALVPQKSTELIPYKDETLGTILVPYSVVTPTAKLAFKYVDQALGGIAEDDLGIYRWDAVGSQWVYLLTLRDVKANTAWTEIDRLGTYALMGKAIQSSGPTPAFDASFMATTAVVSETFKVVIDPDHGGANTGGVIRSPAAYAVLEKDRTLTTAKMVKANLEACGVEVVMTREDDSTVSLPARAALINAEAPDASVTIAHNFLRDYMSWTTGTGSEAWVKMTAQNRAFGQLILAQVTEQTLLRNRGVKDAAAWGGGKGLFVPLHVNDAIPHAQAEMGFMDHYADRTIMDDHPEWFAAGVSNAIFEQLGISSEKCSSAKIPPSPLRFKYRRALGYPQWAVPGMVMEPIWASTGGLTYRHGDLEIPNAGMPFIWERTYNSHDPYCGDLGCGWAHTFGEFIWVTENGEVDVRYDDGSAATFTPGGGGFTAEAGVLDELSLEGAEYVLTKPDQTEYRFKLINAYFGKLISVTERNGNLYTMEYDGQGNLTAIADPAGREYLFESNDDGQLGTMTDPSGRTVRYSYDDQDNLVSVTDANGGITRFEYDDGGHIVRATDPQGYVFIDNTYNDDGQITSQLDASGQRATLTYNSSTETVLVDNVGNSTSIRYDDRYRPVEVIDAQGRSERFEYDDDNNLVQYTDKQAGVTLRTFDARGNLTSKTDPLGRTTHYEYDAKNNLVREVDPLGAVTRYTYDAHNNLIRILDPAGFETHIDYNAEGQPNRLTDTRGLTLAFTYDGYGHLAGLSDNLGVTTSFENDAAGRRTAMTDAEGRTTRYAYDGLDHLISVTDPNGNTTRYTYDRNGNLTSLTDRRGNTTRFEYNADDKVSRMIDALGGVTSYTYDRMYHLTSVTDPLGRVTRYEYDSVYNLVKVTDPRGNATVFTYNPNGQITQITDPLGHALSFQVNAAGQVAKVTDSLGNALNKTYDAGGRLIQETDPRGAITRFEYDSLGNLVKTTDALGHVTAYTYDAMGDITSVTYPNGATVRYERDIWGRLLKRIDPLGNSVAYEYDKVGNLLKLTDENGNATRLAYTANDRLMSRTDALGHVVLYTYDAEDNLLSVKDARGNLTQYTYDALQRMTIIKNVLGFTTTFTHDAVGNLVRLTDALSGQVNYQYDANDNLIARINPLGFRTTFVYDAANQLISATDPRGGITRYDYDARASLVRLTDAVNNITAYTYDPNGNLLTLTDANNDVTRFEYDALNHLTSLTDARSAVTRYEYDSVGQITRLTDPMGNAYAYVYDLAGRLTQQTDPLGYRISSTYDPASNRVSLKDANGGVTKNEYDAVYNLTRQIDAKGNATQFEFDENDNLIGTTNALGYQYHYTYDALNRLVKVENPLGGVTTNVFDALDRLINQTDPKGGVTRYEYDAASQLTRRMNALGYPTDFTYDSTGNLLAVADANDHVTRYVYDLISRVTKITTPIGFETTFDYDGVGNVIHGVDQHGNATSFAYDPNDNLVKMTDALMGETAYEYDLNSNLIHLTNPNHHTWNFEYDAVNNRTALELPLGQRTLYAYDGNLNLIRETNAKGNATNYTYDTLNLLTSETTPMGFTTRYEYDALARLTTRLDALNHQTALAYDGLNRLVTVTDALNGKTNYTYDPNSNLLGIKDANNHATTFDVDLLGQVTGETNPVGSHWAYTYDPVGNLSSRLDANGALTQYAYDADDRKIRMAYPNGSAVNFDYDPNGNLTQLTDLTGVTQGHYDALNRLTQIGHTSGLLSGEMLNYQYDPASNRTAIQYPDGKTVSYAYDANEWLSTTTDPKGGVTNYTYDALGLPTVIRYPNNTQAEYTYDPDNRTTRVYNRKLTSSTDVTSIHDYNYDAVNNVTNVLDTFTRGQLVHVQRGYQYDALDRLIHLEETPDFQQGDHVIEDYTYDAVGNRLSLITNRPEKNGPPNPPARTINYTYDDANRMLTAGATQFTYDANGNRTQKLVPDVSKIDYAYDYENRLTLAQGYRALGNGNWQEDFTFDAIYDGLGRRAEKGEVNQGVRKQVNYLPDGWGYDTLVEYRDPGHPITTQYYRDPMQIISRLEIQGNGDGLQYWYHYDAQGNVTANTNHQSLSVHEYRYAAYGSALDINGSPQDSDNWTDPHNHYLLSGKEFDEETELQYFGSRYYDADTGTWITQDSYRGALSSPMSLHRYAYVNNNPVTLSDWYGFWDFNFGFGHIGNNNGTWSGSVNLGFAKAEGSYNTHTGEIKATACVDTSIVKGNAYYNRTKIDGGWKHDAGVTGAASIGDHTYGLNAHGSVAHGCNKQRGCFLDAAGRILVTKDDEVLLNWGGEYHHSSNRSYKGPGYTSLAEVEDRFQTSLPKMQTYINQINYERELAKVVKANNTSALAQIGISPDFIAQTGINPDSPENVQRIMNAWQEKATLDYLKGKGVSEDFARNSGLTLTSENINKIIQKYNDSRPWYEQVGGFVGGVWDGAVGLVEGVYHIGEWGWNSSVRGFYDQEGFTKQWQDNGNGLKSASDWAYKSSLYCFESLDGCGKQWQGNVDTVKAVGSNLWDTCMMDKARCGGRVTFELAMLIGPTAISKVGSAEKAAEVVSAVDKVQDIEEGVAVYRSLDASGKVRYVGITNNLERRAIEHLLGPVGKIEEIPGLRMLSRADARAVEQALIEEYKLAKDGGALINKINSISPLNPEYVQQVQRGRQLLQQVRYFGAGTLPLNGIVTGGVGVIELHELEEVNK